MIDPIFVKKYFLKGKDEAIDIDFEVASIDAGGVIENEGKKE